jgi:WhiB family redox-sensing transcriptional regulator
MIVGVSAGPTGRLAGSTNDRAGGCHDGSCIRIPREVRWLRECIGAAVASPSRRNTHRALDRHTHRLTCAIRPAHPWRYALMHHHALHRPSPTRWAADARPRSRSAVRIETVGQHTPANLPCQIHDAELWFAETPTDLERAKALCVGCPDRLACLAGAIQRREPIGVWGARSLIMARL